MMKTIERLFNYGTFWDDWQITAVGPDDTIRIGSEKVRTRYDREDFEKFYPGFSAAFDTFSAMGCDQYFVTHVLKLGLAYSGQENIDTFLNSAKVRQSVEAALSLGFDGKDWASALISSAESICSSELPDGSDYNA